MKNPFKRIKYLLEIKYRVHTIYILIIALHWIYGYAYIACKDFYKQYTTINIAQAQTIAEPSAIAKEGIAEGSDEWIKQQWIQAGAKWEEVWAVMQGESGWNNQAWNCNNNKTLDLGLYQLNITKLPSNNVTIECALDPVCSTKHAIGMYKNRGWRPWYSAEPLGLW